MKKPSPIRPRLAEGIERTVLLIDYSNLIYRAYFGSIKSWEVRPWLPIMRFIDSLRVCIQRLHVDGVRMEVIFAGESRQKLDRTNMDTSYKSQRVPVQHDIFRKFRKIMALVIKDMGTTIMSRDGAEADDVIASVASYICDRENSKTEVVVFSNDRDLNQLLRFDNCYIYRSPGIFYTKENFIDEFGFHPSKFEIYKAMVGDKSDNIKGINGFGPVKATNYILNNIIPIDEPDFIKSLKLVSLDCTLDVPIEGSVLLIDDELTYSKIDIFQAYGSNEKSRAFMEIQLALKMLGSVYER